MRKLIAAAFVSLDGVMQAPGGPKEDPTGGFAYGGWTATIGTRPWATHGRRLRYAVRPAARRRTYEIFAAHWPYSEEEPAALFNGITKYVATSSDEPLAWANSVKLEGEVPAAVARLKAGDGPDSADPGQFGAGPLAARGRAGRRARPARLPGDPGARQALVRRGCEARRLEQLSSRTSTTGVVMSRYRPKGPVSTGSFALADPTEAEMARRAKLKAEG